MLSVEYKRSVMDYDFGRGPFCVIYGSDALGTCMLLRPAPGNLMEFYTASVAMTTTMKPVVANIMVRLFGSFRWDYSRKPSDYKGIICLESSLGWELLGPFFFYFLDIRVHVTVLNLPGHVGPVLAVRPTMFYLVDLIHCFRLRLDGMEKEDASVMGRLKTY